MSNLKAKQKHNYYRKTQRHTKQHSLEPDLKGFLCSCNHREKECIREAYSLLNRYADMLLESTQSSTETQDTSKEGDIEDDLAEELGNLKAQQKNVRRFQVMESGAKNFLFIRTTLDDPVKLVEKIMCDIQETKQMQTRFLLRLIPVETTCKAYIKDIETVIEPLLIKYFKNEPRSFSIIFNHRNNNSVSKDEVIKLVADKVMSLRPDHKVNLKEAEVSIIIEVIRNIVLLSVVPHFFKYKKYNLHSICEMVDQNEDDKLAEADATVVDQ